METVLRTLKVRLVADITDYSGPMAAAQAQAAALKAQLSTMFTGLGGMSAAGVTQLIAPIDKLSGRLNGISNQMDTAFRRITQGAATAGREVAALAQTQAKMMQDAVTAANQLRALPAPAAGASAATGAPIGPMLTPSAPRIAQSAQSAMQAAAAAGASRTREMFPIGDSYESQNPIWRMRQKGLEDAAYRDGPGSKAWSDYQNARMAGGLKPAVWHDATKYLEDKSAAGGIAQQMQRMQDQGATMASRSAGLPAVVGSTALATAGPDLKAFAEAQAADAAADLERTIARKAKLAADLAFRKARRELAAIESKAAAVRPKGLQNPMTSDGHGLPSGPVTDKHLYRIYKDQIPAAQAALDAAAAAKAGTDAKFSAASDTAAKARTDLEGFRKQAAEVDGARERSLQVAKRQNDLAAEQQAKRESAHARHLANIQEEERLKARAEHHDRERDARETTARNAAADAERAALLWIHSIQS